MTYSRFQLPASTIHRLTHISTTQPARAHRTAPATIALLVNTARQWLSARDQGYTQPRLGTDTGGVWHNLWRDGQLQAGHGSERDLESVQASTPALQSLKVVERLLNLR